jgi:hypothetical protein
MPDDVLPIRRKAGNVHRMAVALPTLTLPTKTNRRPRAKAEGKAGESGKAKAADAPKPAAAAAAGAAPATASAAHGTGRGGVKPAPAVARVHDSKFLFRSISGRKDNARQVGVSHVVSDWNGDVRPATNMEVLYRSWSGKRFSLADVKSRGGLPFREEDAHKPVSYRSAP